MTPARFVFAVGREPADLRIASRESSALEYRAPADKARGAVLILGHGAGAPQTHPWMIKMAKALAERGVDVVTFNFLYTEAKRRAPDKNDVLEATWRAVVAAVRVRAVAGAARKGALFIGGKSMGGRIASQVAATWDGALGPLAGVVLLGYPLHPPGRPDKLRTAHLDAVKAPMLFVQGARDTFGTPQELAPVLAPLAARGTRLYEVPFGDHSFAVPKSRGSADAVMAGVADEVGRFIASR
jgi:predicted alpha/beta-hydrolase family hydrolase